MKRVFLLALAAGAVLFWYRRRGADDDSGDEGAGSGSGSHTSGSVQKLGGDVPEDLLEILACPVDKQPVRRERDFLVCVECKRHYPIRDGIPVMLVDEAMTPEQALAEAALG